MKVNSSITAAILAAGMGSRFGGNIPKQFLTLDGKTILENTVSHFLKCTDIQKIFIAVPNEYLDFTISLFKNNERIFICSGGRTRLDSLFAIIDKLTINENDILVTHDAARPFVSTNIISDSICAAFKYGAATVSYPVTDSILIEENGFIKAMPDRTHIHCVQTPQSFNIKKFCTLFNSLSSSEKASLTDCTGVFVLSGEQVKIVMGTPENFKITNSSDLRGFINI